MLTHRTKHFLIFILGLINILKVSIIFIIWLFFLRYLNSFNFSVFINYEIRYRFIFIFHFQLFRYEISFFKVIYKCNLSALYLRRRNNFWSLKRLMPCFKSR